jgi:hypothetical protein
VGGPLRVGDLRATATGPLTIGFVTLIINGLASVKTIWNPQSWPLIVGLVLVAFAPFAIFGLFSFAGAVAADGIGSRRLARRTHGRGSGAIGGADPTDSAHSLGHALVELPPGSTSPTSKPATARATTGVAARGGGPATARPQAATTPRLATDDFPLARDARLRPDAAATARGIPTPLSPNHIHPKPDRSSS